MSEITTPTGISPVHWQEEKPGQDGDQSRREHPASKVAETYEETSRGISDKITILGIPIDLMTSQVQASIGGLVSEVSYLKTKVKRYEAKMSKAEGGAPEDLLSGDRFVFALDKVLAVAPPPGQIRKLALVVVNTFEDIRKSSGILAANSVLADVVAALQQSALVASPVGLVGGPIVAAVLTELEEATPLVEGETPITAADRVRAVLEAQPYAVSGLEMNLSFAVSSVQLETGQSGLQAIGQADHVLRS
jgi:hypothetical protein